MNPPILSNHENSHCPQVQLWYIFRFAFKCEYSTIPSFWDQKHKLRNEQRENQLRPIPKQVGIGYMNPHFTKNPNKTEWKYDYESERHAHNIVHRRGMGITSLIV